MDKEQIKNIMDRNIEYWRFKERAANDEKEKLEAKFKIQSYRQLKKTMIDKIDDRR